LLKLLAIPYKKVGFFFLPSLLDDDLSDLAGAAVPLGVDSLAGAADGAGVSDLTAGRADGPSDLTCLLEVAAAG